MLKLIEYFSEERKEEAEDKEEFEDIKILESNNDEETEASLLG